MLLFFLGFWGGLGFFLGEIAFLGKLQGFLAAEGGRFPLLEPIFGRRKKDEIKTYPCFFPHFYFPSRPISVPFRAHFCIAYDVACLGDHLYLPGLNELLYRHVVEVWISPIDWRTFNEDTSLLSRLSRWVSVREPERTMGLAKLFVSWFKHSQLGDHLYKNYYNTFLCEHINDHPLVNLLIDKRTISHIWLRKQAVREAEEELQLHLQGVQRRILEWRSYCPSFWKYDPLLKSEVCWFGESNHPTELVEGIRQYKGRIVSCGSSRFFFRFWRSWILFS